MLDLKEIRENPDRLRAAYKARGFSFDLDAFLEEDRQYRDGLQKLDTLRHRKKKESSEVGRLRGQGADAAGKLADLKKLSDEESALGKEVARLERALKEKLLALPNLPHESVPAGDARNNRVVRSWGQPRRFDFKPKTHLELAERLKLVDFARGAKVAGSHFVLLTGLGARLERALIQFMLDLHTKEHGYTELSPPYLVNRSSMTGTGQLPKLEEDMYRVDSDDLFLIPTAEVPVTNLHAGEILDGARLPLLYTAYTACFRREAGSYGKETKGLTRVHQFDKVELVKFVRPEHSYDELEKLLGNAETVLRRLELPYRVVLLAAGDLSFAAAKCYDLEAWSGGTNGWLEVSSCSNFEAFQARRANIRFRDPETRKVRPLHTLNGSGVALARTVIALLEYHQNADGTVAVPEPLRPYLDGMERLTSPG